MEILVSTYLVEAGRRMGCCRFAVLAQFARAERRGAMILKTGDLEVDTDRLALSRRGEIVELKPRPFSLLVYLIENQARVVSKEEIIETVWEGRAVSDAALSSAVRDIRRALGDCGREGSFLRTYYGRGLRFVGSDTQPATGETAPALLNRESKPTVVAVLPFDEMLGDLASPQFSEGIADDVLARLSKFRAVSIVARNSSFSMRGLGLRVKEIGTRLASDYVLEGVVKQVGTGMRITAQLIRTETETNAWTESYDLAQDQIFKRQDDVAKEIATNVTAVIFESEARRANAKPAELRTAWENYYRGYAILRTLSPRKQREAAQILEHVTRQDPEFATAYAAWSYALCLELLAPMDSVPADEATILRAAQRLKARELAQKALEIDTRAPFAWVAMARAQFALGEVDDALAAAEKAAELNPSLAWSQNLIGMAQVQLNRPHAAIEAFEHAVLHQPEDALTIVSLGGRALAHVVAKEYEEAITWSRKAQLLPDAGLTAYIGELAALGHLGRIDEAREALYRASEVLDEISMAAIKRQYELPDPEVRRLILEGLALAGLE
ncbi:MAG: winged helix-turn-helix domain-containing protein [Pseudomonadota bacterium]